VQRGQIILVLSNEIHESDPDLALFIGAAFATDEKDVYNVLGFPGILRGAVDSNVKRISDEIYLAAADTIATLTTPESCYPTHWINT